jgi:dihydrofolate reductase
MSNIIVACTDNDVIGMKNDLPWYLPADLKHFRDITLNHTVVMGSNTYLSIIDRLKGPLPNRRNIVVSLHDTEVLEGYELVHSLDEVNALIKNKDDLFYIGGAMLFKSVLAENLVDKIYLTRIHAEIDGDTYFPELGSEWVEVKRESFKKDDKNPYDYDFIELERVKT